MLTNGLMHSTRRKRIERKNEKSANFDRNKSECQKLKFKPSEARQFLVLDLGTIKYGLRRIQYFPGGGGGARSPEGVPTYYLANFRQLHESKFWSFTP